MAPGLFDGLKVIDCASYIAAPAAATVMSDFGADVVKIEPPGAGDPYRSRGVPPNGYVHPVSPNWVVDARNKKSLALNLARKEGQAVLRRLVAEADVFITNFPPSVRQRMGIAYDSLESLNPRLIYASFTGFGETGPDADKPGFDATVWWARTGLMDLTRTGDAPPTRSPPGMGDHPSAMALYAAIATALYRRERTGLGSHVGSSLLMNGLWANACSVQQTLCGEEVARQPERTQSRVPLRNCYKCADGRWLILSIVPDQKRWEAFRDALGAASLHDPRFATVETRTQNPVALTAALDAVFATRTLAEWTAVLDEHGVIFGVVGEMPDLRTDEQARVGGALVPFADDDMLTVTSPFWIAEEEKVAPRQPPAVGQHSDAVLAAAGFAPEEIAQLRAQGVVG